MKNQLKTFRTFSEEQKLPRIYCDMDGVIADFLKGSKEIIGKEFNDDLWDQLPLDLYANLPKMPDADKLWNFISKYDLYILTAYPSAKRGKISKTSQGDKVKWMSKYGRTIEGTITKVNTKTIKVSTSSDGQWSVSPSLLKKA